MIVVLVEDAEDGCCSAQTRVGVEEVGVGVGVEEVGVGVGGGDVLAVATSWWRWCIGWGGVRAPQQLRTAVRQ